MSKWTQVSSATPMFEFRAANGNVQAFAIQLGGIFLGVINCDPNDADNGSFLDAPVGSTLIRNDLAGGAPPGGGGTSGPAIYVMTNNSAIDSRPWWPQ